MSEAETAFSMPWGKYKGEELQTIWLTDSDYIRWLRQNVNDERILEEIESFLEDK